LNPPFPRKTPKSTSKKGCGKGGKNKRGGKRGNESAPAVGYFLS